MDLSVVNVVGGGNLNRKFDLAQVYSDFPNREIEYFPESFSAVVIRYSDPKATIMLYRSGKYSLAGAQTTKDAVDASSRFVEDVERMIGQSLSDVCFEIRYLVATADLGASIDLSEAMIILGTENTEYEPEQFPGLFYTPPETDWFVSIFTSGKVMISGCSSKQEIGIVYTKIKEELKM